MAADNDGYGFNRSDKEVRPVFQKPDLNETTSDRVSRRDMELASWWMSELNRRLERCIVRPDIVSYQADLNTMIDQYRQAVSDGAVKAPRLSID